MSKFITNCALAVLTILTILLAVTSFGFAGRATKAEAQIAEQNAKEADENATLFTKIYGRPPVAGEPSPPYYKAFTQDIVRAKMREINTQEKDAERKAHFACDDGSCGQIFYDYGRPFFDAKRREASRVAWYFKYDTDVAKKK